MTYSDSIKFSYAGISSDELGLMNIQMDNGMFKESMASRSIVEDRVTGRPESYFYGFEYSPKEIQVNFGFKATFDDKSLRKIMSCLYQDYYKPLIFSNDPSNIYYALLVSEAELVHNGLQRGYLSLKFRCNSPYSYTPVYSTDYLLEDNADGTEIMIENIGDVSIRPDMIIRKTGKGDISIINNSNGGSETKITGILDNEIIRIDGENEGISSSIKNPELFNQFNYNFLELKTGNNYITIVGDAYIEFKYQGKRYI